VLDVVLVECAQNEFTDVVHLGVGHLGLVAAEEETEVRDCGAHQRHDGGDTGSAGRGHGSYQDHHGAHQTDLDESFQVDRLEVIVHIADQAADDLLRDADRLEQSGQTGLQ